MHNYRLTGVKKKTVVTPDYGEYRKPYHSYIAGGDVKLYSNSGKQVGSSLKN